MEEELQKQYDEAFDAMYQAMMLRKKDDKSFTKKELAELLDNMYLNEGHNWIGRGEVVQIRLAAGIAACEAILHDWKE